MIFQKSFACVSGMANMYSYPWISFREGGQESTVLDAYSSPFTTCWPSGAHLYPSLITMIGRRRKAILLSNMLDKSDEPGINKAHKQVRLVHNLKSHKDVNPVIYIDCELQPDRSRTKPIGEVSHSVKWLQDWNPTHSSNLCNLLTANVLCPLSNVVCYISSDLQGIHGIAQLFAEQVGLPKAHTLPTSALPHALVVVDTDADNFDPVVSRQKLLSGVEEILKSQRRGSTNRHDSEEALRAHFQTVNVIGLKNVWSHRVRALTLRRRISSLNKDVYNNRGISGHLFKTRHIDALSDCILSKFCVDRGCFNFVRSSRPGFFDPEEFPVHLEELLRLLPMQSWIWTFAIPIISSSLFLANYPPGAHRKCLCYY